MKKVILAFGVISILIGGTFSEAQAQEKKVEFSLNLGIQTNLWEDSSFDTALFTLDARLGIPLGKLVELSPEIMAAVDDSLDFSVLWLYPGAMLNFKLGEFFIGVGAVLPCLIWSDSSDSARLSPKVNIGYRRGHLNLTAYFLTWNDEYLDFLDINFIGATIGYSF